MSTTRWPRRDSGPRASPGWGRFDVSVRGESGSASRFSCAESCTSAERSLTGGRPDILEHAATATELPRSVIKRVTLCFGAAELGLAWQRVGPAAPRRRGHLVAT